jgi:ABC-type uncharacterized transport system permease subunit
MLGIVTIAMALLYRLQDSRVGRAWNAIREGRAGHAANGINTVVTKLLAFALGATTAGLAGVVQRLEADDRVARPVLLHGLVHGHDHGHHRRAAWATSGAWRRARSSST